MVPGAGVNPHGPSAVHVPSSAFKMTKPLQYGAFTHVLANKNIHFLAEVRSGGGHLVIGLHPRRDGDM